MIKIIKIILIFCVAVESLRCQDTVSPIVHRTSCFVYYSNAFLSWYEARNECLRKGGDLATIMHADLRSRIEFGKEAAAGREAPHWIGLHSSRWSWTAGCQSFAVN